MPAVRAPTHIREGALKQRFPPTANDHIRRISGLAHRRSALTMIKNLYLSERRVGDVTVLDLKGRVRIIGGTLALHKSIRCLVEEGKTQILLNLFRVTHIDSSGLGEPIASHVTVSNKGGAMKLSHVTERLRDLMTFTKVLAAFDVYNNEQDAVANFTGEVLRTVEPQPFFITNINE